MHSILPVKSKWHERFVRSGYFIGALLLHLIIFVMVATWVIFKAPEVQEQKFLRIAIQPPPPPPPAPPAASGGEAATALEPSTEVTPPPAAPSVLMSSSVAKFNVSSVKVVIPNLPTSMSTPVGSALSGQSAPGLSSGSGSPFGSQTTGGDSSQLVGYLYDLKQTPDKKPTGMTVPNYHKTVGDFIHSRWSETFLDKYYKGSTALSAASIFIPTILAATAPKAFGLEKEVEPKMWVIWYHGKAIPPEEGDYHFVGVADDILIVAVNKQTVLDGSLANVVDKKQKRTSYTPADFRGSCPPDNNLWIGDAFHARAGESVDIDILIGEEPGGQFNAFLFLQRDQSNYEKLANGSPILPIFQIGPNSPKPEGKPTTYPRAATTPEPWTGASK